MNTSAAVGLAIIGTLVAILLWQKLDSRPPPAAQQQQQQSSSATVVVDESPSYVYPVTYTSSPWYVPAYSYGSMHDYRRFHARRPLPIRYNYGGGYGGHGYFGRRSHMTAQNMPASRPLSQFLHQRPRSEMQPRTSPVPRIAMSHPIRAQNNIAHEKK